MFCLKIGINSPNLTASYISLRVSSARRNRLLLCRVAAPPSDQAMKITIKPVYDRASQSCKLSFSQVSFSPSISAAVASPSSSPRTTTLTPLQSARRSSAPTVLMWSKYRLMLHSTKSNLSLKDQMCRNPRATSGATTPSSWTSTTTLT